MKACSLLASNGPQKHPYLGGFLLLPLPPAHLPQRPTPTLFLGIQTTEACCAFLSGGTSPGCHSRPHPVCATHTSHTIYTISHMYT